MAALACENRVLVQWFVETSPDIVVTGAFAAALLFPEHIVVNVIRLDIPVPPTSFAPALTSTRFAPGSAVFRSIPPMFFAETDLEMKAAALAHCEVKGISKPAKRWRKDASLMAFLKSL